jgi:capsular exopolysaccharide synthesis family protein
LFNKSRERFPGELIAHEDPKSVISEAYRSIRTNIEFSSAEEPVKSILVTSAGPKEGKTTTLLNTGVAFAQTGNRVLLLDTDLRRPTFDKIFRVKSKIGLSKALVEGAALSDMTVSTHVPNLYVMTSGPIPPNPAELLNSAKMKRIIEEAEKEYDIILLDSPPLLSVTDALVLAREADGVVLVVQGSKSAREAVIRAGNILREHKLRIIGVVLNDIDLKRENYDYYFYYGYYGRGKRYGYGEEEKIKHDKENE